MKHSDHPIGSLARAEVSFDSCLTSLPTVLPQLQLHLGLFEDILQVSLIDADGAIQVGEMPGAATRLAALETLWRTGTREHFGAALFSQFVPKRIQNRLRQAESSCLNLHLHPDLCAIPWEFAFDGRHQVFRHLPGKDYMPKAPLPYPNQAPAKSILLVDCSPFHGIAALPYLDNLRIEVERATEMTVCLWQPRFSSLNAAMRTANVSKLDVSAIHFVGSIEQARDYLFAEIELSRSAQNANTVLLEQFSHQGPNSNWITLGRQIEAISRQLSQFCLIQWPSPDDADAQAVGQVYRKQFLSTFAQSHPETGQNCQNLKRAAIAFFGGPQRQWRSPESPMDVGRSFRQATALSYDIVGSTELMGRMGADLYSLALHECHTRFAQIIRNWGGVSDLPQGDDGIMCYFGTLVAHEDTTNKAIFAAFELIDVARKLSIDIRVGLATGEVAVSPIQVVGLTVHLAARIQKLAAVGQVLVSETTTLLASEQFDYSPFHYADELKGFKKPPKIFRVGNVLPKSAKSTFWKTQVTLIGRDVELSAIEQRWQKASDGEAHWLHLTGEAGIGKTRLISQFCNGIGQIDMGQAHICRCLAESRGRPFGPIVDLLERWFQISSSDTTEQKSAKLEAFFSVHGVGNLDRLIVSQFLGLGMEIAKPAILPFNETSRHFLLRTSTDWLVAQASLKPLCLVIEDIQWIDPSTVEYLMMLKAKMHASRMLVVLTERTDASSAERVDLADSSIHLIGLHANSAQNLVQFYCGNHELPKTLVNQIVDRSDGVPLFIEMCTRMALDTELAAASTGVPSNQGNLPTPIPVTIADLLTRRIDSLGLARYLAQVCSVVGRSISLELLHALACDAKVGMTPEQARNYLATVLQSGLLVDGPDSQFATYQFRHALVQEAAYLSLWPDDRRRLHNAIARVLESRFPSITASQPEVVAHHCAACGSFKDAAKWHMLAAKNFKTKGSHQESLSQLSMAQAMLDQLGNGELKDSYLLEIHLAKAGQLTALKGSGSQGVADSLRSALALANSLRDKKAILRCELGMQTYHFLRGDFGQAHAYIERAQQSAQGLRNLFIEVQCRWALANLLFHQGEMATSLNHMRTCIQACQSAAIQSATLQSPEVMSLMYASFCEWQLGQPARGNLMAAEAVELAERLDHRLGIGQALGMQSLVFLVCGDAAGAKTASQRAIEVCVAGEHEMWAAHARFMHGAACAALGDLAGGLQAMAHADAIWAATGAVLTRTFYLATMASARAESGDLTGALANIHDAKALIAQHGERYWEPEVLRLEALFAFEQAPAKSQQRAQCVDGLLHAKRCAQERNMKCLALRAAISLAVLHQQGGEVNQIEQLLDQALHAVNTEELTLDTRQARNLLGEIRGHAG